VSELIAVKNLSVHFGLADAAKPAVDQVSLSVAQGISFGIVGESGSGKTTILRVIAGIQKASSGTVLFDEGNTELGTHRTLAQRRAIQMVFQDPYGSLHPRHRIGTILEEPLRIHGIRNREHRVHEALLAVGLDASHSDRFPNQLSGGQRQRVAIARALILEPNLLLLDEPTSALDVSVQAGILNLLNDLRRARGTTLIVVTHDLGVVANLCDHLAVLKQGRLVEQLSVASLASGQAATPYTQSLVAASEFAPGAITRQDKHTHDE